MEKSWFCSNSLCVDVVCFLLCNTDYKNNNFKSPWAKNIYKICFLCCVFILCIFTLCFMLPFALCFCFILFRAAIACKDSTSFLSISFVFCKLAKILIILKTAYEEEALCAANGGTAKDHWGERDDRNSIPKKHLQSSKCWMTATTNNYHALKEKREAG